MKNLLSLAAATVLMMGSANVTLAQSGSPSPQVEACEVGAGNVAKNSPDDLQEGDVLIGRVNNVDLQKSIITLETPVGMLEVALPPEEMKGLNEGDLITVVYVGEEPQESQEAERIII